ncbi:MAG: glycine--tRNA ligase [Tepidisphaeraceae bacterium]
MPDASVMEKIVSLCKRRGFVYPASEIYGGIRGFWDYGPLGVLLKNNIRDWWWRNMVEVPPVGPDGHPVDMVGIDTSIIQHPKTWEASGHVAGFNDPMVDDLGVTRYRADHLYGLVPTIDDKIHVEVEAAFKQPLPFPPPIATCVASSPGEAAEIFESKRVQKLFGIKGLTRLEDYEGDPVFAVSIRGTEQNASVLCLYGQAFTGRYHLIPSPTTGEVGKLTEPRPFNLMLDTYPGPIRDEANKAYLRPETAQGIFLNFKNVVDTTRVKVPFGVAQIGKSFRNEVTPRNFIFRSREFEQMEMEWFCHPDEARTWYEFWKAERLKWWLSLGVKQSNLQMRDHAPDELSHYSKMTVDIEYLYPFTAPDFGELEGIAHRGCFDLTQHQQHSGQKLDYFDQDLQVKLKEQGVSPDEIKARSRYIPNVIEPASGLTRAVLVLLCEGYRHQPGRQGTEEYLSFKPRFAPVKLGIFPLVNKEGMPEVAEKLYLDLRQHFTCEYDPKQSIGKRYARMDEIGTPFCVTIDGQTLADQTVTVRERDTMAQQRISIDQVRAYVQERLSG